ncbi:FHIPEP family domain-containing protein [Ditylenchus destructor]|uniref:FHIPEP family domain-containing protein n=1 Tax=Ditylenchus destructor TaxID=166010 RepID=A0AAD4MF65_9BILA|nr:FHIPEP family domain-containing protein [Ditylenchus destructor]
MAAGLLVTRTTDEEQERDLGPAIARQMSGKPRVLFIAAGVSVVMAMIPAFRCSSSCRSRCCWRDRARCASGFARLDQREVAADRHAPRAHARDDRGKARAAAPGPSAGDRGCGAGAGCGARDGIERGNRDDAGADAGTLRPSAPGGGDRAQGARVRAAGQMGGPYPRCVDRFGRARGPGGSGADRTRDRGGAAP